PRAHGEARKGRSGARTVSGCAKGTAWEMSLASAEPTMPHPTIPILTRWLVSCGRLERVACHADCRSLETHSSPCNVGAKASPRSSRNGETEASMPVADYARYCEMLERARKGKFAYPAVNVTSLSTANAVLKGLAESRSDGFIQISTGGAAFASGTAVKDMVLGAVSIAEHVHRVADRYPVYVALHTDHCQADKLEKFVIPLVEETERRRAAGRPNLFSSHMFDGSALSLEKNLDIAVKLLERFRKSDLILEIEAK